MLNYKVDENTIVQKGVVFPPLSNHRSSTDRHEIIDEDKIQQFNTKSRLGVKSGLNLGTKNKRNFGMDSDWVNQN